MPSTAIKPILCTFLYPPRCFIPTRSFTSSLARSGSRPNFRVPQVKQPSQKSLKVRMAESLTKQETSPNDFGLLEGTFVMPTGVNKPATTQWPRERMKLEWHRLKQRLLDFVQIAVYKCWTVKPRPLLGLFKIGENAQILHKRMYTAFAEGDVQTLNEICTQGLFNNFKTRLARRPEGELLQWKLHEYTSRPRVVSHRGTALPVPGMKGAALRQAVVRIRSRQSLEKRTLDGKLVLGSDKVHEKLEYVVVQRMIWNQKEGPWMVWGTTSESDWKKAVL